MLKPNQLLAVLFCFIERVSRYNIEKLRKLVLNGPSVHPGANLIRMGDGSFVKSLAFGDRAKAASGLRVGDTVERHLVCVMSVISSTGSSLAAVH